MIIRNLGCSFGDMLADRHTDRQTGSLVAMLGVAVKMSSLRASGELTR